MEHSVFPGDSLAPHSRGHISVEDEVKRMNRGRGRQVWIMTAVTALLGVAAVLVFKVMDVQQLRSDAYAAVRTADSDHAQKFLHCALPGSEAAQLTTSATMLSMIERTNQRLGARHAALVGQCAAELDVLDDEVQRLRVPEDARDELEALRGAVTQTRGAWRDYQAFVEASPADSVNALPYMDKAAVAWATYAERRKGLEKALLPPISP